MQHSGSLVKELGRRIGAGIVGVGLILGGILAVSTAPGAAVAAPAGCDSSLYYVVSSPTPQVMRRTPSGTVTSVASTSGASEAIALNPVDGYLYGLTYVSGEVPHVIRIHADGTREDLGLANGVPAIPGNYFAGASFDETGGMWIGPTQGNLYRIDVATLSATARPVSPSIPSAGDSAYIDGALYIPGNSFFNNTLARVDLATGAVTISQVPGFGLSPAAWSTGDGHLYAASGSSIVELIGYTTANPTLVTVATTGVAALDGAYCPTAATPFLNASDDDFSGTPVDGGVGGSAGNVFGNDTLNGATFASSAVTASIANDDGLTGVTIAADGAVAVPASAQPGTYEVGYRICETAVGRTAVCDTAAALVVVEAPVVDAVDNDFTATAITAGTAGTAGNVLANDTINGAPVTPADVTATITNDGGLTGAALTGTGDLTVPATAAAGSYTVTYQLCATVTPTACDTATASVRVAAVQPPPTTPDPGTPGGDPGVGTGTGGLPAAVGASARRGGPLAWTGSEATRLAPAAVTAVIMALGGAGLLLLRRRQTTN